MGLDTFHMSDSSKQKHLLVLEEWLKKAQRFQKDQFDDAEKAEKYYHGDQWTDDDRLKLEQSDRAAIVQNEIAPAVDTVMTILDAFQFDWKIFPLGGIHEDNKEEAESAYAFTHLLKALKETMSIKMAMDKQRLEGTITGMGYVEVKCRVERNEFSGKEEAKITEKSIPWRNVWIDPASREDDLSDARWISWGRWVTVDAAKKLWPKVDMSFLHSREGQKIFATEWTSTDDMEEEERVKYTDDERHSKIFLIETWYRQDGGLRRSIWTEGMIFEDENDPYELNIIPIYALYIKRDHEGKRYGFPRNHLDTQDIINVRLSKAMALMDQKTVIYNDGAVSDEEEMLEQVSAPNGAVKMNPGKQYGTDFIINRDATLTEQQYRSFQDAKIRIREESGANTELQGQRGQNISGKAMEIRSQGGRRILGPILKAARLTDEIHARMLIKFIRHFYTDDQIIRITESGEAPRYVKFNRTIANTHYDLVIGEVESTPDTDQAELEFLTWLAMNNPQIAGIMTIPIVEKMQLRDKDKIIAMITQAMSQPNPEAEAKAQLDSAKAQKTAAETEKVLTEVTAMRQQMVQVQQTLQALSAGR